MEISCSLDTGVWFESSLICLLAKHLLARVFSFLSLSFLISARITSEVIANLFKTTSVVVSRESENVRKCLIQCLVSTGAQVVVVTHVIVTNKLGQILNFYSSMKLTF